MNLLKYFIISLILLLSSSHNISACAQSSPFSHIERLVAGREPGWKLKRWRVTQDNKVAHYKWVYGNKSVFAFVLLLDSPEGAANEFKAHPGGLGAEDAGLRVLDQSAPLVGDESILVESEDNKDKGIVFRKGRVIVRVSAPSLEMAERFAAYIADTIPAAEQLIGRERQ